MIRRLHPFKGLENPREVWAWGMYDFANQSFTLMINTLLFAIFFKEAVVGVATEAQKAQGDRLWGLFVSGSMLTVVLVSPLIGAIADHLGMKKRVLVTSGMICVLLTGAFGLIEPGWVWLAALLYIPANISYQIGENFLASFLPLVSTPRNIGRVSATGWAMGYIGALVLLIITAASMKLFGLGEPASWRPFFVLAAVWFALGMIPPALILKESSPERSATPPLRAGFTRVWDTLRSAGHFKQLVRFLTAFFVYGIGVQTVIFFAGIIAREPPFEFGTTKLVIFMLQLTVTAGIAAILTSLFQDRIGARNTVLLYLSVWILSTASMAALSAANNPPEWMFWAIGNGLGIGLGGIGTASRAVVGRFTPKQKTAEFFGLWGTVYKLAAVVGPLGFGLIKAQTARNTIPLALLAGTFVVGLLLTTRVRELSGVRAARRLERTNGRAE